MKVVYRRRWSKWNKKLLCVTHSDRPVEPEKCSLNYLEKRYADPNRLPPPVPFESAGPSRDSWPYLGQVSIWEFPGDGFGKPRLMAHLCAEPGDSKPQFAAWHDQRLWILGHEILEVFDSELTRLAVITDPWMAGTHTIVPDCFGRLLISCAASDSVLVINKDSYEITKALRMPESIYGFNYPLTRQDSPVDHYIDGDRQLTHINCAWPWLGHGILVSTLIQGAIGWFDVAGNYKELTRGFVGCHGVRVDQRTGQIYFCDSCMGAVIFLTPAYTIDYRVDAGSIWLHDAQQLENHIFALAVADRNQIEIMNFSNGEILATIPGSDFGHSTQFIYYGQ